MKCPRCGVDVPDEEWNCPSCRINLYWVSQHYNELAEIRARQGLPAVGSTPAFLVGTHRDAMEDRATRGGRVEHRVRAIARLVMRRRR